MKKSIIVFLMVISGLPLYAKDFSSPKDVQDIMSSIVNSGAMKGHISREMLQFLYYEGGFCKSCPAEEKKQGMKGALDAIGADFDHYNKYRKDHLDEIKYEYAFSKDNFIYDEPFARSAEHVWSKRVFTGCSDFAKAFILVAINKGYPREFMKYAILMEDGGYMKSCEGRDGQPRAKKEDWMGAGHDVVAVKIGKEWFIVNTTEEKLDMVKMPAEPLRRQEIKFAFHSSKTGSPFTKLVIAGVFPVDRFLKPFTFDTLLNVYASGNPDSEKCFSGIIERKNDNANNNNATATGNTNKK